MMGEASLSVINLAQKLNL